MDSTSLAREVLRAFHGSPDIRLIGGLAVLAHAGELARRSLDVDVVAMTAPSREALIAHLERLGFQVGTTGGWWRAMRTKGEREVVDIAAHPIVNPTTFETVTLRSAPTSLVIGDESVAVVGLDDLVLLKLLAGRDQDIVDLMLLVAHRKPSIEALVRAVESDDVERSATSNAARVRDLLSHGHIDQTVEELLGRAITTGERTALASFFGDLEKEGL